MTGQVFRAVGDSITHYIPWTLGPEVTDAEGAAPVGPGRDRRPGQRRDLPLPPRRPADRRLTATRRATDVSDPGRHRRRRALRLRAGRRQVARSSCTTRPRAARSPTPGSPRTTSTASARRAWGCSRRSRSPSTSGCGRRGPTPPASAARRGSSCSSTPSPRSPPGHADVVVLVYGSTTRADLKRGRRTRQPQLRHPRARAVRRAVRPHAHRQVRDGRPAATCTSSARRSSSSPRSRCRPATTPASTPTPTTATRSRSTTCSRRR